MSEHLNHLIRELRKESCPPHVVQKVRSRIGAAEQRPVVGPGRLRPFLYVAGTLLLLLTLTLTRWTSVEPVAPTATVPPAAAPTTAQLTEQARLSLAYVGSSLIDAGRHTETILREQVQPRLLDSLERVVAAMSPPANQEQP